MLIRIRERIDERRELLQFDLSDLEDEPAPGHVPSDDSDSEDERALWDSDDEEYDAGRVFSDSEEQSDLDRAEAIAADLLEELGDNEVEEDSNIDYRSPYQPVDKQVGGNCFSPIKV